MDVSWAGVAPTLIADGGRVPWAGESESKDVNDKRLSPNPLLSTSCAAPLSLVERVERDDLGIAAIGDLRVAEDFAPPLDACVLGVFVNGVRF